MTSIICEDISLLVGKPIKDELNGEVGKILSFIVDPSGQVSEVLVMNNDGEYKCHPVDRLVVDNDTVVLLSEIDKIVKTASEKIPLLWQKKKALDKLLNESKILPEIYENLHREFGEALEKLKVDARGAINELDIQISNCEEMLKTLHLGKTYLEVEHEIGQVKDEAYKESFLAILNGLKGLVEKKKNLQEKREALSNILLGDDYIVEGPQLKKEAGEEAAKAQGDIAREPTESEPMITVRMK